MAWPALLCVRVCVFVMYLGVLFFTGFRFNFRLHVNDKRYHVQPPSRSQLSLEEMGKLNDVRLLVAQVFNRITTSISRTILFFGSSILFFSLYRTARELKMRAFDFRFDFKAWFSGFWVENYFEVNFFIIVAK